MVNIREIRCLDVEDGEQMTVNRSVWQEVIYDSYKEFEIQRIEHYIL